MNRTAMAQKQAVNVSGAILTDLLQKTFLNLSSHILALYFLLEILRQTTNKLEAIIDSFCRSSIKEALLSKYINDILTKLSALQYCR